MARNGESLTLLHELFDKLNRAGEDSLRAAFAFGQCVDALSGIGYTYEQMGAEVDRHEGTIQKYATLYRRYARVELLIEAAKRYQTFDIARLTGSDEALQAKYGYQCATCGSWDTHRKSMPPQLAGSAR